jgi:hypothetical protein
MQNDIYLEWYPIVLYEKFIQLRNGCMIIPSTLICYDENPKSKICDIVNIFNRGGNKKRKGQVLNNKKVTSNNSFQRDDRINTIEMVWAYCKNGG